jgi:hypothetical protein
VKEKIMARCKLQNKGGGRGVRGGQGNEDEDGSDYGDYAVDDVNDFESYCGEEDDGDNDSDD